MAVLFKWVTSIALTGLASWSVGVTCQEPSNCSQFAQTAGRVIKKIGEITPPDVIHSKKLNLDRMNTPISPTVDRIGFIVLINEKGLVECVDYQNGAEGNLELIDRCQESLKAWQFEIPRDAAGKSVACFDLVVIRLRK